MASAVGELGAILRGGEAGGPEQQAVDGGAAAAAAAAAAGAQQVPGVDISKLSQLSDFADKELQRDDKPAEAQYTQESLLQAAAGNPLAAFQQATQPIPGAILPDAQAMSQMQGATDPAAAAAAEEQQKAIAAAAAAATAMGAVGGLPFDAAAQQQLLQSMALMGTPGMLGVDWSHAMAVRGACIAAGNPQAWKMQVCAHPQLQQPSSPSMCTDVPLARHLPPLPRSCRSSICQKRTWSRSRGHAARAASRRGAAPWTRCASWSASWSRQAPRCPAQALAQTVARCPDLWPPRLGVSHASRHELRPPWAAHSGARAVGCCSTPSPSRCAPCSVQLLQ